MALLYVCRTRGPLWKPMVHSFNVFGRSFGNLRIFATANGSNLALRLRVTNAIIQHVVSFACG